MHHILPALLTIALSFCGAAAFGSSSVRAAEAKQALILASGATYYGQVENGLPNGRGTIKWPGGKTYSGDFLEGKRSGTGNYINEYTDASLGYRHKTVYSGSWSGDRMNGQGTWTDKRLNEDGRVAANEIRTGTFKNNLLAIGCEVVHAEADPDYSFIYREDGMLLRVYTYNGDLVSLWKKGGLFNVKYQKGNVSRSYSIFPAEAASKEIPSIVQQREAWGRTFANGSAESARVSLGRAGRARGRMIRIGRRGLFPYNSERYAGCYAEGAQKKGAERETFRRRKLAAGKDEDH